MAKTRQIMPSIISPGLQVTGNLVCDGDIQVEGTVEGDVRARTVIIGQAGTIAGHTTAERVIVRGKIDGKVSAATVVLHQSAKVFGDIAHETLTIEPGAHLEGHCRRADTSVFKGDGKVDSKINLVVSETEKKQSVS